MSSSKLVEWDTPIAHAESVTLTSLLHTYSALTVELESYDAGAFSRVRIVFGRVFGYRELLEEYMTRLWNELHASAPHCWTLKSVDSPWLMELRTEEPLFALHGGDVAVHYMIATADHVIEVLSKTPPEITVLESLPGDRETS